MPSDVGFNRPPERSNSAKPIISSSRAICVLTAGWVTPMALAAAVTERWSTTARKASRRRTSIEEYNAPLSIVLPSIKHLLANYLPSSERNFHRHRNCLCHEEG